MPTSAQIIAQIVDLQAEQSKVIDELLETVQRIESSIPPPPSDEQEYTTAQRPHATPHEVA